VVFARSCDTRKFVDEPVRLLEEVCNPLEASVRFVLRHSQQFDELRQGFVTLGQLFQPLVDRRPAPRTIVRPCRARATKLSRDRKEALDDSRQPPAIPVVLR